MFDLEQAKTFLRVDGTDNDALISSLVVAAEDYVTQATGLTANEQMRESMADTVKGFLVTLWYFGDHADEMKLQRVIQSLLCSLAARAAEIRAASSGAGTA